jgi:hypothetical protein
VKEEDEEYVMPPHDRGEVKEEEEEEEEEEDVEKNDQNHPHQTMGYWMNRPYWKNICGYHREHSSLLVAWKL